MKDIKRIVLTGGPCAGKTTALAKIVEHFSNLGYQVFTLPEVPTMFTAAGKKYSVAGLYSKAKVCYNSSTAWRKTRLPAFQVTTD